MTVAAVIKSMARELGISQTELAARARMSRASLSLKLNERRDLTLPEAGRLADALGTTVSELLARADRDVTLECEEDEGGDYAIQDKPTGVVILQASHVDIYGEDVPA